MKVTVRFTTAGRIPDRNLRVAAQGSRRMARQVSAVIPGCPKGALLRNTMEGPTHLKTNAKVLLLQVTHFQGFLVDMAGPGS